MNFNGQRLVYQKMKPSRQASNIGPGRIPCSTSVQSLLRSGITIGVGGPPLPLIEEIRLESADIYKFPNAGKPTW